MSTEPTKAESTTGSSDHRDAAITPQSQTVPPTEQSAPERIWVRGGLPISEWTIYSATTDKRHETDIEYVRASSPEATAVIAWEDGSLYTPDSRFKIPYCFKAVVGELRATLRQSNSSGEWYLTFKPFLDAFSLGDLDIEGAQHLANREIVAAITRLNQAIRGRECKPSPEAAQVAENYAETFFKVGTCYHSVMKSECASCLQGHASRMERVYREVEAENEVLKSSSEVAERAAEKETTK